MKTFILNLSGERKEIKPGYEICRFFDEEAPKIINGELVFDSNCSIYKYFICEFLKKGIEQDNLKDFINFLLNVYREGRYPILNDDYSLLLFSSYKTSEFNVYKELMIMHIWDVVYDVILNLFRSLLRYDYREAIQKLEGRSFLKVEYDNKDESEKLIRIAESETLSYLSFNDMLAIVEIELFLIWKNKTKLLVCDECGSVFVAYKNSSRCKKCREGNSPLINVKYHGRGKRFARKDRLVWVLKHQTLTEFSRKMDRCENKEQIKDLKHKYMLLRNIKEINDIYLYFVFLYLLKYCDLFPDDIADIYITIANGIIDNNISDYNAFFISLFGNKQWFKDKKTFAYIYKIYELLNTLHDTLETAIKENKILMEISKFPLVNQMYFYTVLQNAKHNYARIYYSDNMTVFGLYAMIEKELNSERFDLSLIASSNCDFHKDYDKHKSRRFRGNITV